MAETAAEKAQRRTDLVWGSKIALVLATAGLIAGIFINDAGLMTSGVITGSFALFLLARNRLMDQSEVSSENTTV
jgi:Na+/glutamate symporter